MARAAAPESLTPRERDCLRLLRAGLDTPQAASSLGISISTLNKHLASARTKLGVRKTAQALLAFSPHSEPANDAPAWGGNSGQIDDFKTELESCAGFDDTFVALRAYAAYHGVTTITCGLCAEPPGQLTNGARAVAMSYPDYMRQLYRDMGGERADPTVPYTVTNTRGLLVDNERLIMSIGSGLPRAVRSMGDALLDNGMRFAFHQPERDEFTKAPMVTAFVLDPRVLGAYTERQSPRRGVLSEISRTFWGFVQRKRMLRHLPGLTPRQVEALTLAARGFSVAEIAEHMSVSMRSAEKTLAAARDKLGARTTAAAIYRAMVYRVLG